MEDIKKVIEDVITLLDERRYAELLREVAPLQAADAAEIFDKIPIEYQTKFFRLLPKDAASELFVLIEN